MENKTRHCSGKKRLFYAFLATSLAAAIMVICVFLPYGSATGQYAESIKENPSTILDEELGVVAEDM